MRAVIQRVSRASVIVDGRTVARIDAGLLVLIGVAKDDGDSDVRYMVDKLAGLRVFNDRQGKMNLSVGDSGGALLLVSQFTLLADTRKGRRPGFDQAAPPETARAYYERVITGVKSRGLPVETGVFGAHMQVELINDGPVTLLLDSKG